MNEIYETAFQLILAAGDSKSASMEAIRKAREYKFTDAENFLVNAQESLTYAHQIQTNLIQNEARGNATDLNMIMIHAQDHLSMALITLDNAKELLHVYGILYQLLKNNEENHNNE